MARPITTTQAAFRDELRAGHDTVPKLAKKLGKTTQAVLQMLRRMKAAGLVRALDKRTGTNNRTIVWRSR